MRHPVRRLATVPVALLVTLLALAPASARGDHEQHRRHEHRHRGGGFHREPRLEIHLGSRFGGRWQSDHRHARVTAFHCARCHHGFRHRRAFYRHLHHAHDVPFAHIPFVVVHTHFGWIFGG